MHQQSFVKGYRTTIENCVSGSDGDLEMDVRKKTEDRERARERGAMKGSSTWIRCQGSRRSGEGTENGGR